MGGGIGRVYTAPAAARVPGPQSGLGSAFTTSMVYGINTLFTRQFRGFAGCALRGAAAPLSALTPPSPQLPRHRVLLRQPVQTS